VLRVLGAELVADLDNRAHLRLGAVGELNFFQARGVCLTRSRKVVGALDALAVWGEFENREEPEGRRSSRRTGRLGWGGKRILNSDFLQSCIMIYCCATGEFDLFMRVFILICDTSKKIKLL
jgi:hypothetical protein